MTTSQSPSTNLLTSQVCELATEGDAGVPVALDQEVSTEGEGNEEQTAAVGVAGAGEVGVADSTGEGATTDQAVSSLTADTPGSRTVAGLPAVAAEDTDIGW